MLVENSNQEFYARKTFEFSDVNHDILPWLENVINENNCKIEKKEWKSRYNSYVVYEYEPFCAEGFAINLIISSYAFEYINFVRYLYEIKLAKIRHLEKCII